MGLPQGGLKGGEVADPELDFDGMDAAELSRLVDGVAGAQGADNQVLLFV